MKKLYEITSDKNIPYEIQAMYRVLGVGLGMMGLALCKGTSVVT